MKNIKYLLLSLTLLFVFNVSLVGATTLDNDSAGYITMPLDLFKDKQASNTFEVSNLTDYEVSYQIQEVSQSETNLITKIDNIYVILKDLHTAMDERAKLTDGTTEANEKDAAISTYKTEIRQSVEDENFKTLVSNPVDSSWQNLSSNVIPTDNLTENNYYIVWLKLTSGTTTVYKYYPYRYISTSYYTGASTVTNPDTGIETTLLYLVVGMAIVGGSVLVINKNKEIYE